MLKESDIEKIRLEDHQKVRAATSRAEEIAEEKASKVREKCDVLKAQLQDLIDRKHDLFRAPRSKSETIALAKDALREGYEQYFFPMLVGQLKDFQMRRANFLSPEATRVHFFNDVNLWRWVYSFVSDGVIDRAGEMLPEDGLSEKDRDLAIKKIDQEISDLEGRIEKELRKI